MKAAGTGLLQSAKGVLVRVVTLFEYETLSDSLEPLAFRILGHAVHISMDGFYDDLEFSNLLF